MLARWIAAPLLSLATGFAVLIGTSAPATANTYYNGQCESHEVCLYYYTGFSGYLADVDDHIVDYTAWYFYNTGINLNDNVESIKNNNWFNDVCFYQHKNFGGQKFLISNGDQESNLSEVGFANNSASSQSNICY